MENTQITPLRRNVLKFSREKNENKNRMPHWVFEKRVMGNKLFFLEWPKVRSQITFVKHFFCHLLCVYASLIRLKTYSIDTQLCVVALFLIEN